MKRNLYYAKLKIYGTLLAFFICTTAFAQITISGKVSDQNGPLPGVSVKLKGTNINTISDQNGHYSITASSRQETLVFVSIGYKSFEIPINGRSNIDAVLEEEISSLNEVVVVGYGTQKRVNLTGAVSSVDGDDLVKRPVHRASMALQGMASGVTVTQNSGRPGGDHGAIRIRGIGTLGDSNPLVLVDGIKGNLDGVDPNDIENISVLKDAASAAIYGSRGANGVILVTTKRAKSEQLSINYNGYVGKQVFTDLPEFVDGYTYMTKMNEAYANMNQSAIYSDQYLADYLRYKNIDPDRYPDTDWQKEFYTGSGQEQHHYLSISGGNKVKVMSSFAYQDQKGLVPNYRQERYSFRLNANMDIKDNLQSTVLIMGRLAPTYYPSRQGFAAINRISPVISPVKLLDGSWGTASNGHNPIAQAIEGGLDRYDYDQFRTTLQLNYQPIPGADIEVNFSPDYSGSNRHRFDKAIDTYIPDRVDPMYTIPNISNLIRANVRTWENTARILGRYHKTLADHDFSFLGGYEQIAYRSDSFRASRSGFDFPDYQELDAGSMVDWSNAGSGIEWSLRSWFGRINYSFKDRYLLEANVRIDGSSRFPSGKKYGTFPSFSAGWRMSEENFLKDVNWLSELKLRASLGTLGNQEIGNYTFSSVIDLSQGYIFNGTIADGGAQTDMSNNLISWESTETMNLGLDASFFNNKISVNFDYYTRNTSGILLELEIPSIIGLDAPFQNAGKVKNTGLDLALNYRNRAGEFNYQVGFNLSDVKNEVVDLKGTGPVISGYQLLQEGYPINSLYGYKALGLFQTIDQVNTFPKQELTTGYGPGDIIYKDINDDKVINSEDRTVLGNQIPRYTFGLNLSAQFRNFDLSVLLQGVGKKESLFTGDAVWALYNNGKMQTWHLDYWTPENLDAAYPRLIAQSTHNNFQNSSFWVYNAAFARLKNVQIGYTLPENLTHKLPIQRLRVYATGDNVFTLNHMPKGWDPERASGNADIYPIASTFLVGLNITF